MNDLKKPMPSLHPAGAVNRTESHQGAGGSTQRPWMGADKNLCGSATTQTRTRPKGKAAASMGGNQMFVSLERGAASARLYIQVAHMAGGLMTTRYGSAGPAKPWSAVG